MKGVTFQIKNFTVNIIYLYFLEEYFFFPLALNLFCSGSGREEASMVGVFSYCVLPDRV
jgi:hypothetical protein